MAYDPTESETRPNPTLARRLAEVGWAFLPLGWIAFGGPQAHIALLQERFVARRGWLDEQQFVELLGLGQGLPGPTSTQMVVAVGTARAGPLGGLLAFLLFLYPAATIMALAGLGVATFLDGGARPDWLDGVQSATVALVAVAAWRLGTAVIRTRLTMGLMLLGAVVTILLQQPWAFPATLALGGAITAVALRAQRHDSENASSVPLDNLGISRAAGVLLLALFFGLLGGLIVARLALDQSWLQLLESFYRTGSLIFGGGQVVLPMLSAEVVEPGWVTEQQFLDGLALMLALPGPLFSFSAYLGAVAGGVPGLLLAFVGLFLPGVLIIYGVLPFWEQLRRYPWVRIALVGVNATAIGLVVGVVFLLWQRADPGTAGAVIALLSFGAVMFFRVPAPLVIVGAGALGWLFSLAGLL
ncbi:MAG: chromate efflux transporter [Chloroflexota bacterium]|nr:chromate efflux transporter [Chloroflexota bacterium]